MSTIFPESASPDPPEAMPADGVLPDGALPPAAEGKSLLNEHKGKLAIGVAATLGVMIYYNWRERQLAKNDPEGHARLQRLKAKVRNGEAAGMFPEADADPAADAGSPGAPVP